MPKRGKKTRRRREKLAGPDADVTLQQFADAGGSQPPSGRVGKGEANAFVRQAKDLCHGQPSETLKMEEEVPWYEKDWDSDQEETHVDSDTELEVNLALSTNQVNSRSDSQTHDDAEPEVEYPMDIWFMLAPYIKPEDIGRFAAICRNTWLLTRTIGFWRRLYNRYYLSTAQLPERLQRECMERTVCLRTCVIRSLFHLYAPFQLQVNTRAPVDQERFNGIIGSRCMYSWCSKGRTCLTTQSGIRDVWVFYFKLQLPGNLPGGAYHPRRRKLWDVDEDNDDALLNPEDGYCVLRIVAPHFIAVPGTVMGKVMADIKLALSGNMQNHCIMMHFSDQLCTTRKKIKAASNASNRARTKANCSTMLGERVILDPVKSIQVLHWWHPQYPYKYPG